MTVPDRAQAAAGELAQILGQRNASHGDWTSNAGKAAGIKEHLTSIEDPVLREAADAIACKLSRIASGGEYHRDTWMDVCGYALLAVGYIDHEAGE